MTTPPIYLAAGMARSGSTWLFNALRLVLKAKHGSLYSTWIEEVDQARMEEADAILIKLHDPAPSWAETASKTFTSHRDLRDIVVSLRDMGWANDQAKMLEMATRIRGAHDYWSPRAVCDIRYADIVASPDAVLADIAAACDCNPADVDLVAISAELADLNGDPESKAVHDEVTLMHAKHRFDGRPNRFVDGLSAEVAAAIVASHGDWLEKMGYDVSLQPV